MEGSPEARRDEHTAAELLALIDSPVRRVRGSTPDFHRRRSKSERVDLASPVSAMDERGGVKRCES